MQIYLFLIKSVVIYISAIIILSAIWYNIGSYYESTPKQDKHCHSNHNQNISSKSESWVIFISLNFYITVFPACSPLLSCNKIIMAKYLEGCMVQTYGPSWSTVGIKDHPFSPEGQHGARHWFNTNILPYFCGYIHYADKNAIRLSFPKWDWSWIQLLISQTWSS